MAKDSEVSLRALAAPDRSPVPLRGSTAGVLRERSSGTPRWVIEVAFYTLLFLPWLFLVVVVLFFAAVAIYVGEAAMGGLCGFALAALFWHRPSIINPKTGERWKTLFGDE